MVSFVVMEAAKRYIKLKDYYVGANQHEKCEALLVVSEIELG